MFPSIPASNMDKKTIVREIIKELKKGNNVALVAFTGWGKTRTAFEVAVQLASEGYRVGMKFPTLTVAVKKFRELVELMQGANQLSAILTAGAQQYCAYKWHYPQRHCSRCALHNQNVEIKAPPIVTYQDLNSLVSDDACAYWVQERLFPRYNIVIGHYGRLNKILPYVHYLILDEAQELFIPNIKSVTLSEIAEALNVDVSELVSPDVIKEYAEERLINADPVRVSTLLEIQRLMCSVLVGF